VEKRIRDRRGQKERHATVVRDKVCLGVERFRHGFRRVKDDPLTTSSRPAHELVRTDGGAMNVG